MGTLAKSLPHRTPGKSDIPHGFTCETPSLSNLLAVYAGLRALESPRRHEDAFLAAPSGSTTGCDENG